MQVFSKTLTVPVYSHFSLDDVQVKKLGRNEPSYFLADPETKTKIQEWIESKTTFTMSLCLSFEKHCTLCFAKDGIVSVHTFFNVLMPLLVRLLDGLTLTPVALTQWGPNVVSILQPDSPARYALFSKLANLGSLQTPDQERIDKLFEPNTLEQIFDRIVVPFEASNKAIEKLWQMRVFIIHTTLPVKVEGNDCHVVSMSKRFPDVSDERFDDAKQFINLPSVLLSDLKLAAFMVQSTDSFATALVNEVLDDVRASGLVF